MPDKKMTGEEARANIARIMAKAAERLRQIQVPLADCVRGHLYEIRSRNLSYGVFDGTRGFIGIREKMDIEYLDTEYYCDGSPSGTASPLIATGFDIPAGIPLRVQLDARDAVTGRTVAFDKPVQEGGRGWYFTDTNEASLAIRPHGVENQALFDWIAEKESLLLRQRPENQEVNDGKGN